MDVKKTVGCDASGFAFSKPHWVLVFGRDFLRIFIDAEVVVVIPGMYHYSSHDPMTEAWNNFGHKCPKLHSQGRRGRDQVLDSGLFVSSNGFACSFEKTINEVLALFLHRGKVKIMRFSVFFCEGFGLWGAKHANSKTMMLMLPHMPRSQRANAIAADGSSLSLAV